MYQINSKIVSIFALHTLFTSDKPNNNNGVYSEYSACTAADKPVYSYSTEQRGVSMAPKPNSCVLSLYIL